MRGKTRARRRRTRKPSGKSRIIVLAGLCFVMGIAGGYYIVQSRRYERVFFPHTIINGVDASRKTTEEVTQLIAEETREYQLTVRLREGKYAVIRGEDIGLRMVLDGSLERYLLEQEPMRWWQYRSREASYEIPAMLVLDEKLLEQELNDMEWFGDHNMKMPKDAYLSSYLPGQGYVIIPEEPGTVLDKRKTKQVIRKAIRNLEEEVFLEDSGVYREPKITSSDEKLKKLVQQMNRYAAVTVTYQFGEQQEILDGTTISQWLLAGEDGEVILDRDRVAEYVKTLASQYDTAYRKKEFQTSCGKTVTVYPSVYGWWTDRAGETEALCQIILSGQSQIRQPIYLQTANSYGIHDYGDTYVEINLTAQKLFFYKEGELLVETDFVSGSQAGGHDTPVGAYPLTYKERNATLRGVDYETPVSYWMPFNGNIGMHDAGWRSSFGGQIYKTNGSHGCINLPLEAAKQIYEQISPGDPVICYYLEEMLEE